MEAELRAEGSCWFEQAKRQGTPDNDLQGNLLACCQLCGSNLDTSNWKIVQSLLGNMQVHKSFPLNVNQIAQTIFGVFIRGSIHDLHIVNS